MGDNHSRPTDAELAAQYRQQDEERRAREERARAERDQALMATPLEAPATVLARLQRYERVAAQVREGLAGKPFVWRAVDMQHARACLAAMGITLVSRSRAEVLGFVLKRGAVPVGAAYYAAPISRHVDVYVLECQFRRTT